MTCRACVQLQLDVDEIDAIIDTKMINPPHDLLLHLETSDYGRKTDIGTLKKYSGDIFLECCNEIFKAKLLHYVNEVLFEMVKTALKDTYPEVITHTEMQTKVPTCYKMCYNKDTWVVVNQ